MIARLTGTLEESNVTSVVMDVQGVGYEVMIPLSTAEKLPELHTRFTLLIQYYLREDAVMLFGFLSQGERDLFRLLLNYVGGIGPKLALNVLSAMNIADFCQAVRQNDIKLLSRINGVGKKTAERMIVELRDKMDAFSPADQTVPSVAGSGSADSPSANVSDAVAALETLGFKHDVAAKAVKDICAELGDAARDISAEALIRRSLAALNR